MGTIAHIVVYWVYAGINQFLSRSLDKFRLHSLEEYEKNSIPIITMVKGVLLQQLLQNSITQFGFLVSQYYLYASYAEENLKASGLTFSTNPDHSNTNSHVHIRHASVFRPPLHAPQQFLYRHVHSHHHRLLVPYAVCALYNHPVEVISDMLGGRFVLSVRMTPRTSVWFFSLVTVKTVRDHRGLRLPRNVFHVLFMNKGAFHDVHHQLNGFKYNYSQPFFTFWDRIMGTYMPCNVMKRPEGRFECKMMKKGS